MERLERKPLWAVLVALEFVGWGLVSVFEKIWLAILLGAVLITMAVWTWRHERRRKK